MRILRRNLAQRLRHPSESVPIMSQVPQFSFLSGPGEYQLPAPAVQTRVLTQVFPAFMYKVGEERGFSHLARLTTHFILTFNSALLFQSYSSL